MTTIFLDIETLPTNNKSAISAIYDRIKVPSNYSRQESIDKWMLENRENEFQKLFRKTALDGLYGRILSIAWAMDDGNVNCLESGQEGGEKELLEHFFLRLDDNRDKYGNFTRIAKWVGHRVIDFDLRFIWQRCVINGVKPLVEIPINARPWDDNIFDTKLAWSGNSSQYQGKSSLDALCLGMDMDGKGDIDGSKVYDYWLDGRIDEIVEYNKQDVEKTRALYKKMNFME